MDQLVGLSDDLGKLDGFVEQVTRKVAQYLGEVLEDQRDKLQENLMANNSMSFLHIFTFTLGMRICMESHVFSYLLKLTKSSQYFFLVKYVLTIFTMFPRMLF